MPRERSKSRLLKAALLSGALALAPLPAMAAEEVSLILDTNALVWLVGSRDAGGEGADRTDDAADEMAKA